MPKTVDLIQILMRAVGILILLSGALQLTLAVGLIALAAVAANAHPTSPLGIMAVCAVQMAVFSLSSVLFGAAMIRFSAPLARFATRSDPTA